MRCQPHQMALKALTISSTTCTTLISYIHSSCTTTTTIVSYIRSSCSSLLQTVNEQPRCLQASLR